MSRFTERFDCTASPRLAIEDDVERVTFDELTRRTDRATRALVSRGLSGQRVALLATQGSGYVEAFFAIVRSGAVVVPLSPLHPAVEQRWFVEASRASAVIATEDLAPLAAQAGVLVLTIESLRGREPGPSTPAVTGDADVAAILYTSGTTGRPKGALLSHQNLDAVATLVARAWRWSPDDVLLHALPLHHLHGLGISLLVSLLSGGSTRMLAKFDAARAWDAMARSTVLMGVPTMHKKLLDTLDAADRATRDRWCAAAKGLRLVTSGSAALPATVGERWRDLTGIYPLERFGMTEIGVGTTNPIEGPRIPGTAGPPLPGMDVRIVGSDGVDSPPGEPGEIWIQGPSVISGYDGLEEVTRDAFTDGWFKSGDTATWTPEGHVKILGRTSVDILKSGGYKLSALEIEEVLREHPAVSDVAVVGLPDETWGEIAVAAVIEDTAAGGVDEASLRAWAKDRIATYKVPKRVVILDEFPRNPVGKVKKPELTELIAALVGTK